MADTSFGIYESPYLHDLLGQPQALADTVASFRPVPQLTALRKDLEAGKRRRIVLTAMGGSYQVLYPLYFRLLQAGFDALMVETSELIYSAPRLFCAENVFIMVSQSGSSAEVVRALELPGPRPYFIGVTNTPGSPLDRQADLSLVTLAGKESSVSCKTSITALALLDWVAEHLCGGDLAALQKDLGGAVPAFSAYLAHWREHVAALEKTLKGVRSIFFVGRGRSLTAAYLGAMVQKESVRVHGDGMSSAGFRHGAIEMLDSDVFVVVFDGDPGVSRFNRVLCQDVLNYGGKAALAGWEGASGPFLLPQAPARTLPMVELLVPQMTSLAFAGLRGRQPANFERLTKVTTTE